MPADVLTMSSSISRKRGHPEPTTASANESIDDQIEILANGSAPKARAVAEAAANGDTTVAVVNAQTALMTVQGVDSESDEVKKDVQMMNCSAHGYDAACVAIYKTVGRCSLFGALFAHIVKTAPHFADFAKHELYGKSYWTKICERMIEIVYNTDAKGNVIIQSTNNSPSFRVALRSEDEIKANEEKYGTPFAPNGSNDRERFRPAGSIITPPMKVVACPFLFGNAPESLMDPDYVAERTKQGATISTTHRAQKPSGIKGSIIFTNASYQYDETDPENREEKHVTAFMEWMRIFMMLCAFMAAMQGGKLYMDELLDAACKVASTDATFARKAEASALALGLAKGLTEDGKKKLKREIALEYYNKDPSRLLQIFEVFCEAGSHQVGVARRSAPTTGAGASGASTFRDEPLLEGGKEPWNARGTWDIFQRGELPADLKGKPVTARDIYTRCLTKEMRELYRAMDYKPTKHDVDLVNMSQSEKDQKEHVVFRSFPPVTNVWTGQQMTVKQIIDNLRPGCLAAAEVTLASRAKGGADNKGTNGTMMRIKRIIFFAASRRTAKTERPLATTPLKASDCIKNMPEMRKEEDKKKKKAAAGGDEGAMADEESLAAAAAAAEGLPQATLNETD